MARSLSFFAILLENEASAIAIKIVHKSEYPNRKEIEPSFPLLNSKPRPQTFPNRKPTYTYTQSPKGGIYHVRRKSLDAWDRRLEDSEWSDWKSVCGFVELPLGSPRHVAGGGLKPMQTRSKLCKPMLIRR